jgi:D-alanyl-lipoteichoic acid acyltransferase DltB (MBOAT superfamily)
MWQNNQRSAAMIFNSLQYLIFFSRPVDNCLIKLSKPNSASSGSWSFIFSQQLSHLCLFFVSLITYYLGEADRERAGGWRRFFLALSIICALGQLALFKYSGHLGSILSGLLGPGFDFVHKGIIFDASGLLLPLGISFYTFQSLSYVFDIFRGIKPTSSLQNHFCLSLSFPQITSGLIIKSRTSCISWGRCRMGVSAPDLKYGITLIGMGLLKKMVIADNLAQFVDPVFSYPANYNSLRIILATVTFGVQLLRLLWI